MRKSAYKKLADSLDKSPALADAVGKGEISAATAETLHDTIANPPAGADVGELIEAVKGAGPRDAKPPPNSGKTLSPTKPTKRPRSAAHTRQGSDHRLSDASTKNLNPKTINPNDLGGGLTPRSS